MSSSRLVMQPTVARCSQLESFGLACGKPSRLYAAQEGGALRIVTNRDSLATSAASRSACRSSRSQCPWPERQRALRAPRADQPGAVRTPPLPPAAPGRDVLRPCGWSRGGRPRRRRGRCEEGTGEAARARRWAPSRCLRTSWEYDRAVSNGGRAAAESSPRSALGPARRRPGAKAQARCGGMLMRSSSMGIPSTVSAQ